MKTRIFVALVLLASLMLALSGGAAAQENPPYGTPAPGRPPQQPTPAPGDTGTPDINAQAIALGQPGTSFRYLQTFGVTEEAYPADVQHINNPVAVSVDGSDNVVVVEELGNRVLKYRGSDGENLLSIGKAGIQNRDTYIFDDRGMWPWMAMAIFGWLITNAWQV